MTTHSALSPLRSTGLVLTSSVPDLTSDSLFLLQDEECSAVSMMTQPIDTIAVDIG